MFAAERQAIIDRAEAIGKEDYFTILGVSQEAPFDVVQSAYFSLAKKWHPDRLPPELADLREHAAKIFARMSEASQTLTDPDKRKKYIDNRTQGLVSADEQQVVNRIVEAAFDFQKADILLKKRDYSGAEALSRKAFDADPEQADYLAVLAWCIAQQPARLKDKNFVESLDMLNKAIKLQEKCERAYFYRGSLLALMGKGDAAARDFRRSVELNPRNVEAVRQLRLFEMRGAGASAAPPSANAEPKETASDSAPINWTQDGVGTILGKLFKK
jgi:curved DNA-binding protein CbpA